MSKNKFLLSAGLFVFAFAFVLVGVPSKVFATGTISSIAPNFGIVSGGTAVTITGIGTAFTSGALTVTFGGVTATSISAASATSITAVTPSGTAGAKNVVVSDTTDGTLTLTNGFTYVVAPTAINLGTAANYAILAESTVTTTGVTSIVGNVGLSPAAASYLAGFGQTMDSTNAFSTSPLVAGKIYASDYSSTTPANLGTAVGDMLTAYNNASNSTTTPTTVLNVGAGNLGGSTLVPGVYTFTTGVIVPTNFTLSGSGVYIFQIPGTLSTSSATKITLSNGATAANIFWAVAGATTLGTNSTFEGNILDQTNIAMATGATLNGKALAQTAVTLDANNIADSASSGVAAAGTAGATAYTKTLTYTLTNGTFDSTAATVVGNWTLAGTNVADLGTISSVVLSNGNKVATITVSGTTGVVMGNVYTVTPTSTAFVTGFTTPSAATVVVTARPISGIVAPSVGATPVTTAISGTGYTGTVSWSPADATFVANTVYTATVTLTATTGYTLTGVGVNEFTIAGATATNPANSGVITAVFPMTIVYGNGGGQLTNGQPTSTSTTTTTTSTTATTTTPATTTTVVVTNATPTAVTISGCNSGTTGFSTVTGQSCSTNTTTITTTTPTNIAGCLMGTTGFSTVSGVSCAGNTGTTTITTSYNFGSIVLKRGSTGVAVQQLQMFLNKNLGLTLTLDGLLGPKTIAIVKQWQKAHGLTADGLVGAKTKALMNSLAQ